jgi:hypothetical protein
VRVGEMVVFMMAFTTGMVRVTATTRVVFLVEKELDLYYNGNQMRINDNIDFEADYNDEFNRENKLGPYSEEELMPYYQTESNGYSFRNHYGNGSEHGEGMPYGFGQGLGYGYNPSNGYGCGYGFEGGGGGDGGSWDLPDLGPLDNNYDDEWLQHEQFDAQYEQDNYEYYS